MADESSNPYAPPATQETLPDLQRGLWKCDGTDLWVRTGAFLPGVDLLTGVEVRPEDAKMRQISLMPLNPRVLIPAILIGASAFGRSELESRMGVRIPPVVFPVVVVILVLLLGRWFKVPTWLIRYHQSKRSGRRRVKPLAIWIACIIGSCVVSALGVWSLVSQSLNLVGPLGAMGLVLGPPVVTALVGGFLVLGRGGQLTTGGRSGEWLLLRGVHPKAMDYLRNLQVQVSSRAKPHPHLCSYVVHMARYPLLEWFLLLRWRPLPCLNLMLTKLFRPGALDTRAVGETRPVMAGPEVVSADFRDRVRLMEPDLQSGGWSIHTWIHLPIPDRFNSHSDQVCLFHQDHRDLMFLSRVRGDAYPERYSVSLYGWLPDGTCLKTSDDTAFATAIPEGCEWEQLTGVRSPELIARHMRKSLERGTVRLSGALEAFERVIRLNLEIHARLEAKRICGPLEEISA